MRMPIPRPPERQLSHPATNFSSSDSSLPILEVAFFEFTPRFEQRGRDAVVDSRNGRRPDTSVYRSAIGLLEKLDRLDLSLDNREG
jgi:hypothetical protein